MVVENVTFVLAKAKIICARWGSIHNKILEGKGESHIDGVQPPVAGLFLNIWICKKFTQDIVSNIYVVQTCEQFLENATSAKSTTAD